MRTKKVQPALVALAMVLAAGTAQAHPGHGEASFMAGIGHPFGLDHLLAMVAVGVWSVLALPRARVWQGPATFLLALMAAAVIGAAGVSLPFVEQGIALSVILFGAMLVLATRQHAPGIGLALVAVAASLHGLAHGAEAPASGFLAYAFGFLLSTALLHAGGMTVALAIKRWFAAHRNVALGSLGSLLAAVGLVLFGRLVF